MCMHKPPQNKAWCRLENYGSGQTTVFIQGKAHWLSHLERGKSDQSAVWGRSLPGRGNKMYEDSAVGSTVEGLV